MKGTARTLVPTTKNYALEPPRFGVVAGVSPCGVQCTGLVLEAPPSWSRSPPRQVSMNFLMLNSALVYHPCEWNPTNYIYVRFTSSQLTTAIHVAAAAQTLSQSFHINITHFNRICHPCLMNLLAFWPTESASTSSLNGLLALAVVPEL